MLVYRGMSQNHKRFKEALLGKAPPRGGHASAAEHNIGNTDSPYTSWTTNPKVADGYAGEKGAVLIVDLEDFEGSWEMSPDVFREDEILIKGAVENATVTVTL